MDIPHPTMSPLEDIHLPNSPSYPYFVSQAASDGAATPLMQTQDPRFLFPNSSFDRPSHSTSMKEPFASNRSSSTDGHLLPLLSVQMQNFENTALEVNPFASSFSTFINNEEQSSSAPSDDEPRFLHEFHTVSSSSLQDNDSSYSTKPLFVRQAKSSDSVVRLTRRACFYNPRFPETHRLRADFLRAYDLGGELGAGGYGFVMTAVHRAEGIKVAVKFIIKDKIPSHAWTDDDYFQCRVPTEVSLLHYMSHTNVVGFVDLFQDSIYYYLIQELHGSPWPKFEAKAASPMLVPPQHQPLSPNPMSPPCLSPSASEDSIADSDTESSPPFLLPTDLQSHVLSTNAAKLHSHGLNPSPRPQFTRIASHDLFECIEQSVDKKLPESSARYIFSQVVDAVYYLHEQNICHRDIKDENILVDARYKIMLIDFGSAVWEETPRRYHTAFYGTTAYASSEILQKKKYLAAPAEIWTLGVLLSYLLCGRSPFPTEQDAIAGKIVLTDTPDARLSRSALNLMSRCCEPDPTKRATIAQVRAHPWLRDPS